MFSEHISIYKSELVSKFVTPTVAHRAPFKYAVNNQTFPYSSKNKKIRSTTTSTKIKSQQPQNLYKKNEDIGFRNEQNKSSLRRMNSQQLFQGTCTCIIFTFQMIFNLHLGGTLSSPPKLNCLHTV